MNRNRHQLVILGVTSNGDLLELIDVCNREGKGDIYEPIAFLDDDSALVNSVANGLPVAGPLRKAREMNSVFFVNAIGAVATVARRQQILAQTGIEPHQYATFIHPCAFVSPSATVGAGSLIFASATVCADTKLGICCDIMPQAVVSHGGIIGDYSFVASGSALGGHVRIGAGCFLGLNSSVRERISIGDRTVVGQGAVVVKDVPAGSIVAGNPARPIGKEKMTN